MDPDYRFWSLNAKLDRFAYLISGVVLFGVKNHMDRLIASGYDRPWALWDYWLTGPWVLAANNFPKDLLMMLLLAATPFAFVGMMLTVHRLNSLNYPIWLVTLFLMPFLNVLFFFFLSLAPPAEAKSARPRDPANWEAWVPESRLGSALFAVLITLPFGTIATLVFTLLLNQYGGALFLLVPFGCGMLAAVIHGHHQPRTLRQSLAVALTANVLMAVGFLVFAVEGLICIAMASPIWGLLAGMGGAFGYMVQAREDRPSGLKPTLMGIVAALCLTGAVERAREAPLRPVSTAVIVNATPQVVWDNLIAFPPMAKPRQWYFKAGVAYPTHAHIEGRGPGAVRYCEFTTGAFVEPIEIWDEPNLLRFSVTEQPLPMRELSPYPIEPPHLDGAFRSEKGQMQLTQLADGRTRLEGTTWYRMDLWPNLYWRLWGDEIIHRIHTSVLTHIKIQAESN